MPNPKRKSKPKVIGEIKIKVYENYQVDIDCKLLNNTIAFVAAGAMMELAEDIYKKDTAYIKKLLRKRVTKKK
jgi:hypothetical protein